MTNQERKPTLQTVSFFAFTLSLAFLIKNAAALPLFGSAQSPAGPIPIAAERWSPPIEQVWIGYHVDMLEGVSFRQQHLHQEALAALLMNNASQLPRVRPCGLKVRFRDGFGDFAIGAGHPNPARRFDCLRVAVDYLLRQPISESDFLATDKRNAYSRRMGYASHTWAQPAGLLAIYQKHSPLYQIHSVGPEDLSDLSFDEFDLWLRRSRAQKLISFVEKTALLHSLGLPLPDPMVLRPVPSLKSRRVPAGVLFLEKEDTQVPALIMVGLDVNDPVPVDKEMANRLACNASGPARLGAPSAGSAISGVSCQISDWFGDGWLSLAVRKSDGASYIEFCRQAQDLTNDAVIAAVVRGSPEGSKGLYVLLPPACKTLQ